MPHPDLQPAYAYDDLDGTHVVTRQQILDRYWSYWSGRMRDLGRHDKISEDNCVADFLIVHWAWQLDTPQCQN